MKIFYHLCKNICNLCCSLWFRVEIYGLENIPKTGSFVLVSNHQSYIDPVLLGMRLKRSMRYMAKAELFQNKLFGGLIRRFGAFPVHRGAKDDQAIKQAIQVLKDGDGLLLFPEGTRSKTGELKRFKSGAIFIAKQGDASIIPAAVSLPEQYHFRSHIIIQYGQPILLNTVNVSVTDLKSFKPIAQQVQQQVWRLLQRK